MKTIFQRDWAHSVKNGFDMEYIEQNYICNKVYGTTFSGHPTKTTLGNTIRSICYAFYYIQ